MTRFVELSARGQTASGKTVLLAWIADQLTHVGIVGTYIKGPDEHRMMVEIEDGSLALLAGMKDSTYGKRMLLSDDEVRLIEEHRLSQGY